MKLEMNTISDSQLSTKFLVSVVCLFKKKNVFLKKTKEICVAVIIDSVSHFRITVFLISYLHSGVLVL